MQEKEKDRVILRFVDRVRLRLNRDCLWKYFLISAVAGLGVWTLINSVALIRPIYGAVLYGAVACGIILLAGMICAVIKFPDRKRAALAADSKGLKERVTTALELMGDDDIFSKIQKDDTIKAIRLFDIKKNFPFILRGKWLIGICVCIIAVAFTGLCDSAAKQEAIRRHHIKELAETKKEELEEKLEDLLEENKLTEAQKEEMKELLEQALKELKNAQSEAGIEKAEERLLTKLEQQLDKSYEEQAQAIDNLSQSLKQLEQAALSKEETEELLKELAELAEQLDDEKLAELAEQLKNEFDAGEISAGSINQTASQLAKLSGNAQAMLSNNGQQSGNSGQNQGNNSGQGEGGTGSEGSGEGSGSGSGGSGEGSGSGSGGSSTGGSSSSGSGGSGTGGSGQGGTGWNTGSNTGAEREANLSGERVMISDKLASDNSNITGKPSGDGESQQTQSGPTVTWSGIEVEYGQVIAEYTNQAYAGLEKSNIPDSMKDIVKDYFTELNK